MLRGSSLSDPAVIDLLNREFVAVQISLTNMGVPVDVPALEPWAHLGRIVPWYRIALSTTAVIDPTGRYRVAASGCMHPVGFDRALHYRPERFLAYLRESLRRFRSGEAFDRAARAGFRVLWHEGLPDIFDGNPPPGAVWCRADPRGPADYFGVDAVGGEIVRAFGDPDPEVRRFAAEALGRLRSDGVRFTQALHVLLEDPSPVVRDAAAASLRRIEGDR